MPYAETVCRCLYCKVVTGRYPSYTAEERVTVCGKCQWGPGKDERREVMAGVGGTGPGRGRPWMRPLSFWVHFFGQTPMPDDEAARFQRQWDLDQAEIKEFNRAHAGTTLEAK